MIHWHLNQVDQVSFYYDCAVVNYTLKWQLAAGTHQVLVQGISPHIMEEKVHYELLSGQHVEKLSSHLLYQRNSSKNTYKIEQKKQAYQQWQNAVDQYTYIKSNEQRLKGQMQHWIKLMETGHMQADEWRRGFLKLDQEIQSCITMRFKAEKLEQRRKKAYENYNESQSLPYVNHAPKMIFTLSLSQAENVEISLSIP